MAEIEIQFEKYGNKPIVYDVPEDVLEYIQIIEGLLLSTEDALCATLDLKHKTHDN